MNNIQQKLTELINGNANTDDILPMLKYIESLEKDSDWLGCLEAAGVDNWQGIDGAAEMYRAGK